MAMRSLLCAQTAARLSTELTPLVHHDAALATWRWLLPACMEACGAAGGVGRPACARGLRKAGGGWAWELRCEAAASCPLGRAPLALERPRHAAAALACRRPRPGGHEACDRELAAVGQLGEW